MMGVERGRVLDLYETYDKKKGLPPSTEERDALVKYCSGRLRCDPKRAKEILRDVDLTENSKFLFPALRDRKRRSHIMELVLGNGLEGGDIQTLSMDFKHDPVIMRYLDSLGQIIDGPSDNFEVQINTVLRQLYYQVLPSYERIESVREAEGGVVDSLKQIGLRFISRFDGGGFTKVC